MQAHAMEPAIEDLQHAVEQFAETFTPSDPRAVANYFIRRTQQYNQKLSLEGDKKNQPVHIDALSLQKMVFVAHGYHLAKRKRPLIDEIAVCVKTDNVARVIFRTLDKALSDYKTAYVNKLLYHTEKVRSKNRIRRVKKAFSSQLTETAKQILDDIWEAHIEFELNNEFWSIYTLPFLDFEGDVFDFEIREYFKDVLEIDDNALPPMPPDEASSSSDIPTHHAAE